MEHFVLCLECREKSAVSSLLRLRLRSLAGLVGWCAVRTLPYMTSTVVARSRQYLSRDGCGSEISPPKPEQTLWQPTSHFPLLCFVHRLRR